MPDVQVVVASEAPACTSGATLPLAGRAHADDGLAWLRWSVNGIPPQMVCTSCGTDRDFAFDLTLVAGDNIVLIEAQDPSGRQSAAELTVGVATESSAGDLRPGAAPLRITEVPGGLLVTWEPEPRDAFALHAGTLASLHAGAYDHSQLDGCDLADASTVIAPPVEDTYILVTSGGGAGDGSHGRDSFWVQRPASENGSR